MLMFDLPYLIVMALGAGLSFLASAKVKSTFAKYSQIGTRSRMTGADVARKILEDHGIRDVRVEGVAGS